MFLVVAWKNHPNIFNFAESKKLCPVYTVVEKIQLFWLSSDKSAIWIIGKESNWPSYAVWPDFRPRNLSRIELGSTEKFVLDTGTHNIQIYLGYFLACHSAIGHIKISYGNQKWTAKICFEYFMGNVFFNHLQHI